MVYLFSWIAICCYFYYNQMLFHLYTYYLSFFIIGTGPRCSSWQASIILMLCLLLSIFLFFIKYPVYYLYIFMFSNSLCVLMRSLLLLYALFSVFALILFFCGDYQPLLTSFSIIILLLIILPYLSSLQLQTWYYFTLHYYIPYFIY